MTAFFAIVTAVATLTIVPGWRAARRRRAESPWLLALPAVGVASWAALTAGGLGAQSLSNVVEVLAVGLVAVVVAYGYLLLSSRRDGPRPWGPAVAVLVVVASAIAFRLFMPSLPE